MILLVRAQVVKTDPRVSRRRYCFRDAVVPASDRLRCRLRRLERGRLHAHHTDVPRHRLDGLRPHRDDRRNGLHAWTGHGRSSVLGKLSLWNFVSYFYLLTYCFIPCVVTMRSDYA